MSSYINHIIVTNIKIQMTENIWFYLFILLSSQLLSQADRNQVLSENEDSSFDEIESQRATQCTSRQLVDLSNEYEICHRKNIEKIEEQFIDLDDTT